MNDTIEIRNFCPSCAPEIAECAPRVRTPRAGLSPEILAIVDARGYMSSHDPCAAHFAEDMKRIAAEPRECSVCRGTHGREIVHASE